MLHSKRLSCDAWMGLLVVVVEVVVGVEDDGFGVWRGAGRGGGAGIYLARSRSKLAAIKHSRPVIAA